MLRAPVEDLEVVELVADLETDHAALGRQFLQQVIRHVARDVVEAAQAVVGGHDRVRARLDGLRDGLIGGVRNVDHHAQAVHLPDHRAAAVVQAVPLRRGAAGVGVVVGPVVRGQLRGAQAQAVQVAQHAQVAVQIEAAFEIQHRRDLAGPVDALDVGGVERQLDRVAGSPASCVEREVDQAERLLGFEALRVVVLGDEDGEEHGVEAAFLGARAGRTGRPASARRCRRRGRTGG